MTAISRQYRAASPRSCVISTIAIPRSAVIPASSSITVRCVVTSSPVVGSSAISSAGSHAIAIAIITRWHIPPDSSDGYAPIRRSGSRICTARNSASTRPRTPPPRSPVCARSTSPICRSTVRIGFSADRGFWKIIDIAPPRSRRNAPADARDTSSPRNRTHPPVIRPARSSSRMIANDVTDFPDPLSPTIPSVPPASSTRLIPCSASTTPCRVRNATRRSSTSSSIRSASEGPGCPAAHPPAG